MALVMDAPRGGRVQAGPGSWSEPALPDVDGLGVHNSATFTHCSPTNYLRPVANWIGDWLQLLRKNLVALPVANLLTYGCVASILPAFVVVL